MSLSNELDSSLRSEQAVQSRKNKCIFFPKGLPPCTRNGNIKTYGIRNG